MGFTKKSRTSHHMFILKTIIDKYCNNKDVDFQKASDTVIHTRIKIKLLENDIGHHFFNIIKNMYSQSKSCVKLKNTLTDFFGDYVGVK